MMKTSDLLKTYTDRAGSAFSDARKGAIARDAAIYLTHTESGCSMREIARATGSHPSTISRAVRRVEASRDDPLVDQILTHMEGQRVADTAEPANTNHSPKRKPDLGLAGQAESENQLGRAARKYLRRLSEPGAFLLIVQGLDKAGVFCAANGHSRPIATFSVSIAADFLKQDWIRVAKRSGQSVRYRISDVGRSALRRMLSEDEMSNRAVAGGFAEAPSAFKGQHSIPGERVFANPETGKPETVAVNIGESPIGWLTRRKGAEGKAHLDPVEVEAAERLRADFEAAHLGPSISQDWQRFLTAGCRSSAPTAGDAGAGSSAARQRVSEALGVLGPGLADVALRTCCFLEGLEVCERRMGWNPRSAKVVLKIALQRLAMHYGFVTFPK